MAGMERAAAIRTGLADMVEGLTPEQQAEGRTLCGEWNPHQVLAHVTMLAELSIPRFLPNMIKAGFNYDKMADRVARKMADENSVAELASRLRASAERPAPIPSFPPELTVADAGIHTQDVRRGLGLDGALSDDDVKTALIFMTEHKQAKNIFDTKKLEGLRLEATDIDWSHGEGATVSGPAEALMLGLASRPVTDELTGAVERLG